LAKVAYTQISNKFYLGPYSYGVTPTSHDVQKQFIEFLQETNNL